ncbi:dGTP triphosphohydrolase [Pseudoduganella armeniaca]|uniref:Deoxyguanosinetriphosphate triphosphohydrolase n=1 Tax=Pseudoduganella armeniaca TaxID=2072590 RepID=A0A2R4CE33_9BURK|nr:dNTP triphosphohydrolase [Pseudoduganella armeniaca]AVR97720.1 deoxyguanosinetriphosphate triphosphohydrolase [Pseudoduganella armeniaca]
MYDRETKAYAREQEQRILPLEYRAHAQTDGRAEGREECMRDYARVLYSASFRRLQGKMQLLGVDANNFNRNRLTHSLEVAQIARSIAADLGLERSVVAETCALAHDIGNPPFGHYGERILNELGAGCGGFEGNAQAFRILRTLEKKHHAYAGLNLTVRSLAGITKYFHTRAENPRKFLYDDDHAFLSGELARHGLAIRKSIDAQIMDLSDEIAYAAHDLEDALSFGIITWGEILHEFKISKDYAAAFEPFSRIAHGAHEEALKSEAQASSEEYSIVLRKEMTSQIVHELCRDIAVVEGEHGPELGYRSMGALATGLKSLLWRAILRKKDVQLYEKRGEKIIRGLFEVLTDTAYNKDNVLLPPELRCLKDSRERLVIDYIAGMMDSSAAQEYEKYFGKGSLDQIYWKAR